MRSVRQALTSPVVLVLLAPFILFAPVYLAGQVLFWGTPALQFTPWWSFAFQTLRAGHLPLWNPLLGMGAPLLANYQIALFYPPTWIYLILAAIGGMSGTDLMAWAQALLVALHLAWAGLGMVFLVRRLGLSALAQAVAGLAFGLCGYLVARAGFLSINAAAAWTPWILFTGYSLVMVGRRALPGLAACVALQLLAGHAQTAWYTLLLAGLWVGFWAWQTHAKEGGQRWKALLVTWGWFAAAVVLAILVAAVQLIPTAEYLAQSQRAAAVDFDYAMTYSFWPWRLLTLIAPAMFGSPVSGDYWGYGAFWEDALYIGLLPLLLALGALVRRILRRNTPTWPAHLRNLPLFLLAVSAVALVWGLGKNTPVFPWLYSHVPTFSLFQAPTRVLIWGEIALALLAGLGAEIWHRPEGRSLYWTRLGTAGAFAVTLGAGLALLAMRSVKVTLISALALAGAWGVGAGLLSLVAPTAGEAESSLRTRMWQWGVALFVAADLLVAGWGLNPGVTLDFYQTPWLAVRSFHATAQGQRIFIPVETEERLKYKGFLVTKTFSPPVDWQALRELELPNLNVLDQIAFANNYDPMVPGRFARWMEAVSGLKGLEQDRLLDLMGAGAILQAGSDELSRTELVASRTIRPRATQGRARWLPCAQNVSSADQAFHTVISGTVDLGQVVVLEGMALPAQLECLPPATAPSIALDKANPNPNQVRVSVQAGQAGWLLLSDTCYPGWQATVDGQPVEILHGDYLFRAVAVPAGQHEIIFTYRPRSFFLGALLSLLGGVILLGLMLVPGRYSRRKKELVP